MRDRRALTRDKASQGITQDPSHIERRSQSMWELIATKDVAFLAKGRLRAKAKDTTEALPSWRAEDNHSGR